MVYYHSTYLGDRHPIFRCVSRKVSIYFLKRLDQKNNTFYRVPQRLRKPIIKDFRIFIDGDHTYEGVRDDIIKYSILPNNRDGAYNRRPLLQKVVFSNKHGLTFSYSFDFKKGP